MGGAYLIDPDAGPMRDTLEELGLDDVLRPYSGQDLDGTAVRLLKDSGTARAVRRRIKSSSTNTESKFNCMHVRLSGFANGRRNIKQDGPGFGHTRIERRNHPLDGPALCRNCLRRQFSCIVIHRSTQVGRSLGRIGIDFLAAEEFDLWVYPGGLGQVSRRLWQRLIETTGAGNLRNGLLVFDVRLHAKGVQLTYIDNQLKVASLVAKAVMIACQKVVSSWIDDKVPPERLTAMRQLDYRSYAVANVLINQPTPDDYYDLFLIQNGVPMSTDEAPTRIGLPTHCLQPGLRTGFEKTLC